MAAVLAHGREALLSHLQAAALGLATPAAAESTPPSTPDPASRGARAIAAHGSGSIPSTARARVDAILVTYVPRTLLDGRQSCEPLACSDP